MRHDKPIAIRCEGTGPRAVVLAKVGSEPATWISRAAFAQLEAEYARVSAFDLALAKVRALAAAPYPDNRHVQQAQKMLAALAQHGADRAQSKIAARETERAAIANLETRFNRLRAQSLAPNRTTSN